LALSYFINPLTFLKKFNKMTTVALLTGFAALVYLLYKILKPYKFYEEEEKELSTDLKRCNDTKIESTNN